MPDRIPCHRPGRPTTARLSDGRPSSSARGYDRRWRKLREVVLRAEPLCRHCLQRGESVAAAHVDHDVALAAGGTDDLANLVPLCHSCHSRKTVQRDGGFGRPAKL